MRQKSSNKVIFVPISILGMILINFGCSPIESVVAPNNLDTGGHSHSNGDEDPLNPLEDTNDSNDNGDSETIHDSNSLQDADNTNQPVEDKDSLPNNARILFLHHSTGGIIWEGGVQAWINSYYNAHGKNGTSHFCFTVRRKVSIYRQA